jgi:hypothetical protein
VKIKGRILVVAPLGRVLRIDVKFPGPAIPLLEVLLRNGFRFCLT